MNHTTLLHNTSHTGTRTEYTGHPALAALSWTLTIDTPSPHTLEPPLLTTPLMKCPDPTPMTNSALTN
eukprot:114917-Heterocapsa_arctica.AAC.1